MRYTITRSIIQIFIILTVAACNLDSENATATADGVVSTLDDNVPTTNATNSATYVDEVIGFSIDYPSDWWVEARAGELFQLFSANYAPTGPGGDGFPEDMTKIEIIPQHPGDPRSLDEVLDLMRNNPGGPGGRVVSETVVTLAGDVTAYRLEMENMVSDRQPVLLTVINGRLLQVAGYGDTARFDEILLTLRPSE